MGGKSEGIGVDFGGKGCYDQAATWERDMRVERTADGTEIWVGEHRLACITLATDQAAVDRLVELVKADEGRLAVLGQGYDKAVELNRQGAGRNWPVFGQREREVNRLCKLAGIVDT